MVSRRALAPVAALGEATKPGLAPNGSLNQQSPQRGEGESRENMELIQDIGTRACVDAFYPSIIPLQLDNFVRVLLEQMSIMVADH